MNEIDGIDNNDNQNGTQPITALSGTNLETTASKRRSYNVGNKNAAGGPGGGRPSVFETDTRYWLAVKTAVNQLIAQPDKFFRYSESQFVLAINQLLADQKTGYRFSLSAFSNWKNRYLAEDDYFFEKNPRSLEFVELYLFGLLNSYNWLFDQFEQDSRWQKWAWILERRFENWNLQAGMSVNANGVTQILNLTIQAPTDVPLITSEQSMIDSWTDRPTDNSVQQK